MILKNDKQQGSNLKRRQTKAKVSLGDNSHAAAAAQQHSDCRIQI